MKAGRKGHCERTTGWTTIRGATLRLFQARPRVGLSSFWKWGHLRENPARGVDLPKLRCVRPKWALTRPQAAALLDALPMMPRTMVGLAILSGLRRGELFALRWRDIDEQARLMTVREAVYDGVSARRRPKPEPGRSRFRAHRSVDSGMEVLRGTLRARQARVLHEPGHVHLPEQRPAAPRVPSVHAAGTSSSNVVDVSPHVLVGSHDRGVPGKVVAQLMGHANVDTTLNVYTQVLDGSLRQAAERSAANCSLLFTNPRSRVGDDVKTAWKEWCALHDSNVRPRL